MLKLKVARTRHRIFPWALGRVSPIESSFLKRRRRRRHHLVVGLFVDSFLFSSEKLFPVKRQQTFDIKCLEPEVFNRVQIILKGLGVLRRFQKYIFTHWETNVL